ncbi:MAG: 2'-5' RNA ligase family protein [Motilibacteraceae bacterium]
MPPVERRRSERRAADRRATSEQPAPPAAGPVEAAAVAAPTAGCHEGAPTRTIGVAIPIPEPWGGELQRHRESFGDPMARSIPTHVTLLPPTEVPLEQLEAVEDHLQSVAGGCEPYTVRLRGTATFRPVSPVVFVQLAQGIAECERLEEQVRSGPLARETAFNYHPHVTVAHHLPDEALDRAFAELADYDVEFEVWGFSLFGHGPDGVWRPQRDYVLGQALPGPVPEDG